MSFGRWLRKLNKKKHYIFVINDNSKMGRRNRTKNTKSSNEVILPKNPTPQVYNDTPLQINHLPMLNLIPTGEENCYSVDMKPVEDLKSQIDHNYGIIQYQLANINGNEQTLNEQTDTINLNNQTINYYTHTINQQITAFNNNSNLLNQQAYHINAYNAEIARLQQVIEGLNIQIADTQAQLEDTELQLEGTANQLAYHNSILNALNTLIQNPLYFSLLMLMQPLQTYEQPNTE